MELTPEEDLHRQLRQRLADFINADGTVRDLRLKLRNLGVTELYIEITVDNGNAPLRGIEELAAYFRGGMVPTPSLQIDQQLKFSAADKDWLKAMHIDPEVKGPGVR
jgi:hypothetical protein